MVPLPKNSVWELVNPTVIYFTTKTKACFIFKHWNALRVLTWLKPSSTPSTYLGKLEQNLKLTLFGMVGNLRNHLLASNLTHFPPEQSQVFDDLKASLSHQISCSTFP